MTPWRALLHAALLVGSLIGPAAANPMAQREDHAYTYVTANHMCFKKETIPAAVANNCCFSGIKLMATPEFSTDGPGSDIQVSDSPSPESCETDCRNEPACQAYTWVRAGVQGPAARCWLKKARPAKVSSPCCVSGVRLPPPRRLPADVLLPHAPAATR